MSAVPSWVSRPAPRARRSGEAELEATEALMLALCSGSRLDRLGAALWEHVGGGGRRLRARLAIAAGASLGAEPEELVPWAAACELLHNATLVHDDLQDRDTVRRGREALWVRHGEAQAINAGDLALMLPTLALRELPRGSDALRWRLAEGLAAHAERIVRGQALEMELLPREQLDWARYREAVVGKTAALFALPVYGAALIAGRPVAEASELAAGFGEIGVLFQVQDDVVDLFGDKGRGAPGSDLREGKVSALVVEHLALHPEDRAWLLELLRAPRERTPADQIDEAIRRFRTGGALARAWSRLEEAQDAVSATPALRREHRLHAVAIELIATCLAPIAHTHPNPPVGGPT